MINPISRAGSAEWRSTLHSGAVEMKSGWWMSAASHLCAVAGNGWEALEELGRRSGHALKGAALWVLDAACCHQRWWGTAINGMGRGEAATFIASLALLGNLLTAVAPRG